MENSSPRPRLVFMGTPGLARTILAAVADDGRWDIPLVVAQPDRPVGRGLQLRPPPVKEEALARSLPVAQPQRARDPAFLDLLRSIAPDVILVAAYGQILPPALLSIPRHGCLNVHTSILPRWRGAAPIQWAIAEGDAETGVTLMRMDAGLDTGDIVAVETTPIQSSDTGGSLHDRLADLGGTLVRRYLGAWIAGGLPARAQPSEGVTYARKLEREDGRLEWSKPAVELDRRIRAFDPWPGAYTTIPSGIATVAPTLLKVWAAEPVPSDVPTATPGTVLEAVGDQLSIATGTGTLRIHALQREGRRRVTTREFLNHPEALRPGVRLGSHSPPPPAPAPAASSAT